MEEARETAALEGAVFTARLREEEAPTTGEHLHLRVPPRRLHFFDQASGVRLAESEHTRLSFRRSEPCLVS